jgi:hypothetical protein
VRPSKMQKTGTSKHAPAAAKIEAAHTLPQRQKKIVTSGTSCSSLVAPAAPAARAQPQRAARVATASAPPECAADVDCLRCPDCKAAAQQVRSLSQCAHRSESQCDWLV